MKSLYAIYRKEMGHYFVSPVAYVVVGVFLALSAFFFNYFLAAVMQQALQMQMEPHFLFNTLGSAQQLAKEKAPEAARLIGDLIVFLRAAAPSMPGIKSTLSSGGVSSLASSTR